jgi:hypothetical protein
MKRFKSIGLALLCLPALAIAKSTPDDVYQLYKQRLSGIGRSLNNPFHTATETLVNGVYAFWNTKENSLILTNESASIFSQDGGKSWVYMNSELSAVTDVEALRSALLSNVKLEELIAQRYGKGQRKVIYFTAFDCPFCANFEKNIKPLSSMGNATLYAVPRNLDTSDAIRGNVVRALWCANSSFADWSEFVRTRKPKPEVLRADMSQCSALRTSKQAGLLQSILTLGQKSGVPFLMTDEGWAGTPSAQPNQAELKAIFTPTKSMSEPLKFGRERIDLANWGAEKATQSSSPITATSGGFYLIGEGLRGSDDVSTAKPVDPEAHKKLKAKLKKIF